MLGWRCGLGVRYRAEEQDSRDDRDPGKTSRDSPVERQIQALRNSHDLTAICSFMISPLVTPARYADERRAVDLPYDPHLASVLTEKLEHPIGVRRREHDRSNDRCSCGPQLHGTGMGLEELLDELPWSGRTALRSPYLRDHESRDEQKYAEGSKEVAASHGVTRVATTNRSPSGTPAPIAADNSGV